MVRGRLRHASLPGRPAGGGPARRRRFHQPTSSSRLLSYLEEPLPTTKLVVAGGGGTLPAKFVNAFKQAPGATLVNTDVSSREAHGWVSQRLAHGPVKLAPAAAALVEEHLGEDLEPTERPAGHPGGRLRPRRSHRATTTCGPTWASPARCRPGTSPTPSTRARPRRLSRCCTACMEAGDRHPLVVLAILHRHFGNVLRVQSPDDHLRGRGGRGARASPRAAAPSPPAKPSTPPGGSGLRGTGDAIMALADAELALKGKMDLAPEAGPGGPGGPPVPALPRAPGERARARRWEGAQTPLSPALCRSGRRSALASAVGSRPRSAASAGAARVRSLAHEGDLRLAAWLRWMMPRWAALSSFFTAMRRSSGAGLHRRAQEPS